MIDLYSGTPGSGKSFHACRDVFKRLKNGKSVITNFPVDKELVSYSAIGYKIKQIFKNYSPFQGDIGKYTFKSNIELTVSFLKEYAKENHKPGKEHQTLVVIDECGIMFNTRNFGNADRMEWIEFLSLHRHYGYDFILISQSDRMIDRQIRGFIEYEHKHRNVGHFKFLGALLALVFGGSLFIDVTTFYGMREKVGSQFFRFKKRIGKIYDSYALYDDN